MTDKSTFAQEGFVSDEVHEHLTETKAIYKTEFSLLKEINLILMETTKNIPVGEKQKNNIATILSYRFLQSLQCVIILCEYRFNAEVFTIIRNMQETYLALAMVFKNDQIFELMCWKDEKRFKDSFLKHIKTSPIMAKAYHNLFEKADKNKLEREREYIKKLAKCGLTTEKAKKSIPNIDATSMYEQTKTNPDSQRIYTDYKLSSNLYAHVSLNSILIHYKNEQDINKIIFRCAEKEETRSAVKDAILTSMIFAEKLNLEIFDQTNTENLKTYAKKAMEYFKKIGTVIEL